MQRYCFARSVYVYNFEVCVDYFKILVMSHNKCAAIPFLN